MKITAIKQQVKQSRRYSIFVDGKYAFSLSDSALLDSQLVTNQELTAAEVADWKKRSLDDKLYARTLQYVVMRPRSIWEVEFYLKRKQTDPLLAQYIVNKLSNLHLLDDVQFAQSWITNRRLLKPVSHRRLIQELRAKHVADEIVASALADDETDELVTLKELVAKKRKQTKYQDDSKLMQFLARQGFSYDDIKAALQTETA